VPPAGVEGSLACPSQRLVHVGCFQYPKATNVLLGFQVRPVGDERFATRLPPHRLRLARRTQPASHQPGAGSFQLVVEITDSAYRRFGHARRIEVVGKVIRKQILRHDFSFVVFDLRKGCLPCPYYVDEWPDPISTNCPKSFI